MLALVHRAGVLQEGALFANGHGARPAEVFEYVVFVSGARDGLLADAVAGPVAHESVLGLFFHVAQVQHSVALEAVHELVRHDAVRAEVIRAVDAASYGVGLFAFAAGAAGGSGGDELRIGLDYGRYDQVGQQAVDAGAGQRAVDVALRAGDFAGVGLLLLEAGAAESVKAGQNLWLGEGFVAQAASGVESVELSEVADGGVAGRRR